MFKHMCSVTFLLRTSQGASSLAASVALVPQCLSASAMSFGQVSVEELFGIQVRLDDLIQYERLRCAPKVFCTQGHEVILSRIPWQSGCNKCKAWGQDQFAPSDVCQGIENFLSSIVSQWSLAPSR